MALAEAHARQVIGALRARYEADPRFIFRPQAAKAAAEFFPRYLRHTNGPMAGQPFHLLVWQKELVELIFGWFWAEGPEFGRRIIRQVFLEIARKNGKSTFCAGLAWLMLLLQGDQGVEIYNAAADKDQASIVFADSVAMGRASPALASKAEFLKNAIVAKQGVIRPLSADAETKHGLRPAGVLFDELHTQKNRNLYDVLHTAVGAHPQPLEIYITTAGVDRTSICYEVYEYACRVRDGVVLDPSFLPIIFEADAADDFTDPRAWAKANPSIGRAVRFEFLQAEAAQALERPGYQNTYRRLYMNQWTESVSAWISQDLWRRAQIAADEWPHEEIARRRRFAGLDLSAKKDLTALGEVFPPDDPEDETSVYYATVTVWTPADSMADREKTDRVPYPLWARQGHLNAVPGLTINHAFVAAHLAQSHADGPEYAEIAFDPWRIDDLRRELTDCGEEIPLVKHGQGFQGGGREDSLWMPRSVDEFERLLLAGRLKILANPCLDFAAASAVIERDAKDNRVFTKKKSTGRIDPIAALAMATGAATRANAEEDWSALILGRGGLL